MFSLKKNTNYTDIGPIDVKDSNKTKVASASGFGAVNNNTTSGFYTGFTGSGITFSDNKAYDCHVLLDNIVGGVNDFAFDYKKWAKDGDATVQVLVNDVVVADDIKLSGTNLATYKLKINKEDASSVKVKVKNPSESSNGQRVAVGNFRWTKF